jgi:hypothetical protein
MNEEANQAADRIAGESPPLSEQLAQYWRDRRGPTERHADCERLLDMLQGKQLPTQVKSFLLWSA